MRIFGIYGGYLNHDPGVCLVEDGEIVVDLDDGDNYTPKGKLITLIKKIPKRKKVSE